MGIEPLVLHDETAMAAVTARLGPRIPQKRINVIALGFAALLHVALVAALLTRWSSPAPPADQALVIVEVTQDEPDPLVKPPPLPPVKTRPVVLLAPVELPPLEETPTNAITVPASPPPPVAAPSRQVIDSYRTRLLRHLNRLKRYPPDAQRRREEGVAYLAFTIDASGRVLSFRLVRSSGSAVLDDETMTLIQRASPVPAPPPDMGRGPFQFEVPVEFTLP